MQIISKTPFSTKKPGHGGAFLLSSNKGDLIEVSWSKANPDKNGRPYLKDN
jgi:hypothetical protein